MAETAYIPRLRAEYDKSIRPKLTEQFGYRNLMQVPRVDKIVLNMGIGEGVADRKKVEQAAEAMAAIAGQKPVITKESPIHLSNIAIVGKDGKPTRVGFKIQADGKKVRIAKRSGAEIDG